MKPEFWPSNVLGIIISKLLEKLKHIHLIMYYLMELKLKVN